ncbi:KEOPS complex Cgi121-like subunit [Halovivax asiaticus JCM 14624]|uniref:KEOPS complex Cgi121-like subunit n=1 Tax=Halovivax asiaticus JCM 14624 TaxID=1227490 RepID=M0BJ69_9EURY|nr:KEOPS complex subunit Cgi121 [Halovivax asiaticus]ELZ10941.1 KEOPS complex Cgi121-like subunit [Halovivax asiaticus JCM 14624]
MATDDVTIVGGELRIDDLDAFLATIDRVAERHDVTIQAFDARYVAGTEHLERAVASAERAIANDDAIARDPAVELLLYAAGRRQIERALEMGVDEGTGPAAIVVTGGDEAGAAEALRRELDLAETAVLDECDERTVTEFFDIDEAERDTTDATLAALVRERVALLAVEK